MPRGHFWSWFLILVLYGLSSVAAQSTLRVSQEQLSPDDERIRNQVVQQEASRTEGKQKKRYDDSKSDMTPRIGMLLPEGCTMTPDPRRNPSAAYYLLQCEKFEDKEATIQFAKGAPYMEIMKSTASESDSGLSKVSLPLRDDGLLSLTSLLVCDKFSERRVCHPTQVGSRRVNFSRSDDELPTYKKVVVSHSTLALDSRAKKSGRVQTIELTAFENEPLELVMQTPAGAFGDLTPLMKQRGHVNSTVQSVFRPRGHEATSTVYLTDHDHMELVEAQLKIKTLPSTNPLLYDLRPSLGRLEPSFRSSNFAYYLRVPENSMGGTAKIRLTSMDDRLGRCSYVTNSGEQEVVAGEGITASLSLGPLADPSIIVLECWHSNAPDRLVRYIVQVVYQKGGDTRLKNLDVYGGKLEQVFEPDLLGPYTVAATDDAGWVAFRATPANEHATVTVEGYPCDENGVSPFFKMEPGEKKAFRIEVRTPENAVAETYTANVQRAGSTSGVSGYANALAWGATAASSTRAYHFLGNMRMLQWVSVTSRIPNIPNNWESFSSAFNKFNMQFSLGDAVQLPETQRGTVIPQAISVAMDESVNTNSSDRFVAAPSRFGISLTQQWVEPLALAWSGNRWVKRAPSDEMIASVQDAETEAINTRANLVEAFGLGSVAALTDVANPEFFECKPGDETKCEQSPERGRVKFALSRKWQGARNRPNRMLVEMDPEERLQLSSELDATYRHSQDVTDFVSSLLTTMIIVAVVGCVYIILYLRYMKLRSSTGQNRAYPRWLHPVRFWLFMADIAFISFAQACCGLAFSPLKDQPIMIFGHETTPRHLSIFCMVALVLFPVAYMLIGTGMLAGSRKQLVFSKTFQRYHDRTVTSVKALWQPLPWLPILGRLFDIEVANVAPVLNAPYNNVVSTIVLGEEDRKGGAWADPNIEEDDESAMKKLNENREMKYYYSSDYVRVYIDDSTYLDNHLDSVNAGVTSKYPDAFVGCTKQPIRNLYANSIVVNAAILLKHLPPLVNCADRFTITTSRENLHLLTNDKLSNIIAHSQKGHVYSWVVDRAAIFLLILVTSMNPSPNGHRQFIAFAVASLCLLCLAVPAVLATGVSKHYQQIEADKYAQSKVPKYDQEDLAKFNRWPFKDPRAREAFMRKMQRNEELKRQSKAYGWTDMTRSTKDMVINHPFWSTRAGKTTQTFVLGSAFTELLKVTMCITLLFACRSLGTMHTSGGGTFAIMLASVAILALNWEAFCMLWQQIKLCSYECYIGFRRAFLFAKDSFSHPGELSARMAFYMHQTMQACVHMRSGVSFIFPGFSSETVRDFWCDQVTVVCNEVGTVMPGPIKQTNKSERRIHDADDATSITRHTIQKTLFTTGTIGVQRNELDRSLPVQIPFSHFYAGAESEKGTLVATLQIVNHASLRYIPRIPHDASDDSYLSLYTDVNLVPPAGTIRKTNRSHGYVVKLDKVLKLLTIRGPGILPGKNYSIKVTKNAPPGDELYSLDDTSSSSSRPLKNVRGEAQCHCLTPGILVVDVPPGMTPDFQQLVTVRPPSGVGETFDVDPVNTKVSWDNRDRVMIIRSRFALLSGDEPYVVYWDVKNQGRSITHAMTEEPISLRGILTFGAQDADIDLDYSSFITIRDADKTLTIDVDPKDTNAHEFDLSGVSNVCDPVHSLTRFHARAMSEIDTMFSNRSIKDPYEQRIPCTIVQLVDPIGRKYRVEPDFEEALRKVNARQEQLIALRSQLNNLDCLPEVWYHAMSPGEFVEFWKSCGLDILEDGVRFVDPTREPDHPKIRGKSKMIREGEAQLRVLIERKLHSQEQVLARLYQKYSLWLRAYCNFELYTRQAELEIALQQGDPDDIERAVMAVKALKTPYQRDLGDEFVYPMIVDESLISKCANWEAQYEKWYREVDAWLHHEEAASVTESMAGGLSCHEQTLMQIMHALRYTCHKPEEIQKGRSKTALHFVTSSRSVRGLDTFWRPDPLGAMYGAVRVWRRDGAGQADFHPSSIVYMPCMVKLSGNAVKIMLPQPSTAGTKGKYSWTSVAGWYIPLQCFERIECSFEHERVDGAETNPDLTAMVGKIVFRRNLQIPVDDNYVKVIATDEFGNDCGDNCKIMLAQTLRLADGQNLPASEQHSLGDYVSAFPLTFRLFRNDLLRWQSVVWACGMYKPPRDVRDFDGRIAGRDVTVTSSSSSSSSEVVAKVDVGTETDDEIESLSVSSTSSSSVMSSAHTEMLAADIISSESTEVVVVPDPEPVEHDPFGESYLNWRYRGAGELKNPDRDVIYEGGFKDGQRFGTDCSCKFTDPKGVNWDYKGDFWMDEFSGPGKLTMRGGQPVEELRRSNDPSDKHQITAFEGDFQLPPEKAMKRTNSVPHIIENTCGLPAIDELYRTQGGSKLRRASVDSSRSSSSSSSDAEKVREDREVLALDPRRTASACGDELIMAADMRELHEQYNEPVFHRGGKRSAEEMDDMRKPELLTLMCNDDEALAHSHLWTRRLDPNLGFQGLDSRFGKGLVSYADGCRFHKMDVVPLDKNRPNGLGIFHCPICPLIYYGFFRKGRPHGRGILEFGTEDNRIMYKGEFQNGQRHGRGQQVCLNGRLYMEGDFKNDTLSGDHVVVKVDESLVDKFGFVKYAGSMLDGLPHGRGELTFRPERERAYVSYNGNFVNGLRDGPGVMSDANGTLVLDGFWIGDVPEGRVNQYRLPDGKVYCGTLVRGELQGVGQIFTGEGGNLIYEGTWYNNVPHGRGTLKTADGIYEGEFTRGRRHGKGTFSFYEHPTANGRARVYEGDWKDDLPHGTGAYLAEDGKLYTFEFENGKVTPKSRKAYKDGGACGKQVEVANPVLLENPVAQHNPRYWGRQCFPKPNLMIEVGRNGAGLWAVHEAHPFSYRDPTGLGDMPGKPSGLMKTPSDLPTADELNKEGTHIIRVKVKRAEGLPVVSSVNRMNPYVVVLLSYHQKKTTPHEKGHTDPVWEQSFRFAWIKEKNMFFNVYDKASLRKDRPIAAATFDLASWLESDRAHEDFHLALVAQDEKTGETIPAGRIYFSIEQYPRTDNDNVSEDSYGSRNLQDMPAPIQGMGYDKPIERHVEGENRA